MSENRELRYWGQTAGMSGLPGTEAGARSLAQRPLIRAGPIAACLVLVSATASCASSEPAKPALELGAPPPASTTAAALRGPEGACSSSGAASAGLRAEPPDPDYSSEALLAHVQALSSDSLGGRLAGTVGEQLAAQYVASKLDRAGVGPLHPDGLRIHSFPIPRLTKRGAAPADKPRQAGSATPAAAVSKAISPTDAMAPALRDSGTRPGPPDPGARTDDSRSRNVYGMVSGGGGTWGNEVVVVGAHIDHVGVRGGQIQPGADDNASGVAVTLEIAGALQRHESELGRSIIVAFFGAEEDGMLGASAFLRERPKAAENIVAMVNVDMVGRRLADRTGLGLPMLALGIDPDRSVGVLGTKGQPVLRTLVDGACRSAGLAAVTPEDLPGPLGKLVEAYSERRGDSWPFEFAGIPALFFSSGESDDYHAPGDTPEKLRPELMVRRARAIHQTVVELSKLDRRGIVTPGSP